MIVNVLRPLTGSKGGYSKTLFPRLGLRREKRAEREKEMVKEQNLSGAPCHKAEGTHRRGLNRLLCVEVLIIGLGSVLTSGARIVMSRAIPHVSALSHSRRTLRHVLPPHRGRGIPEKAGTTPRTEAKVASHATHERVQREGRGSKRKGRRGGSMLNATRRQKFA